MNATFPVLPELRIAYQVTRDRVTAVEISKPDLDGACAVLLGLPAQDAVDRLHPLFGLCGIAQTVAGLAAAETILGLDPPLAVQQVRHRLTLAEALEQTLWRLLLTLPPLIGKPPAVDAMAALRRTIAAVRATVAEGCPWRRLGGGADLDPGGRGREAAANAALAPLLDALEERVQLAVLGPACTWGQDLGDSDSFILWASAGASGTARLCRAILVRDLGGFGRSPVRPLASETVLTVAANRLLADRNGRFRAKPEDIDGAPRETGAWARHWQHPLCAGLAADHGNGVLARLAAVLVDLAALLAALRAPALGAPAPAPPSPWACRRPQPMAAGTVVAAVETARGTLLHLVGLQAGRVCLYRALAPTDWNGHPQGPLARGLLGAATTPPTDWACASGLLLALIDPCHPARLVRESAHAQLAPRPTGVPASMSMSMDQSMDQ